MAVHTVMMVAVVAVTIVAIIVAVTITIVVAVIMPISAKYTAKHHPIKKIAHNNKNLWLYFCDIRA